MYVESGSSGTVLSCQKCCQINFKSGTFVLDKAADSRRGVPAEHRDYEVDGWVICFIIRLNVNTLNISDTYYIVQTADITQVSPMLTRASFLA